MIPNILAAYGLKKSAGTCFFSKVTDAAGDHWITVHPNGPGTKGQPVLLSKGGEIKGGMGGKFNGLHISSAKGSQGDPLTRGNVELQRSKWQQKNFEKAPKGVKQYWWSKKANERIGHTASEVGIVGHPDTGKYFYFPSSEIRLTSTGAVSHMSPKALEFFNSYKKREEAFEKEYPNTNWMLLRSARNKHVERLTYSYKQDIEKKFFEARNAAKGKVRADIDSGKYKGDKGLEKAEQELLSMTTEYAKITNFNGAGMGVPEDPKREGELSITIPALQEYINKRKSIRYANAVGRLKKQYEQLNLF